MSTLRRVVIGASMLVAVAGHADVLILDHELGVDSSLSRVDSTTDRDSMLGAAALFSLADDIQVAPDGYVYFARGGGSSTIQRALPNFSSVSHVIPIWDASDIALDAAGALMVVDRRTASHPESGLYEIQLDGTKRLIESISGFHMMAMDVPHAGPFRDGILVIGFDAAPPNDYYLYRYRRLPDGRLDREGPFGPLEASPYDTCRRDPGFIQRHLAVRRDGLSFLSIEGCSSRVLAHDIDGHYLGPFAVVDDDPTVRDPLDPTRVYDDFLTAVHVTAEDEVYVTTKKRLRHYRADGGLVGILPRLFRLATALGEAEPIPFEPDNASCRASGTGYWKRQCLTREVGFTRRPTRSRPLPVGGPSFHPTLRNGRLVDLLARVTRDLEPHGVDACSALWPTDPSSWRSKTLTRLAALYLDIEDHRLGLDCVVDVDHEQVTVRAALLEIRDLIEIGTDDAFKSACHVAENITGGTR